MTVLCSFIERSLNLYKHLINSEEIFFNKTALSEDKALKVLGMSKNYGRLVSLRRQYLGSVIEKCKHFSATLAFGITRT